MFRQVVAKYFADAFNQTEAPKKIAFIEPYCVELRGRPQKTLYNVCGLCKASVVVLPDAALCIRSSWATACSFLQIACSQDVSQDDRPVPRRHLQWRPHSASSLRASSRCGWRLFGSLLVAGRWPGQVEVLMTGGEQVYAKHNSNAGDVLADTTHGRAAVAGASHDDRGATVFVLDAFFDFHKIMRNVAAIVECAWRVAARPSAIRRARLRQKHAASVFPLHLHAFRPSDGCLRHPGPTVLKCCVSIDTAPVLSFTRSDRVSSGCV